REFRLRRARRSSRKCAARLRSRMTIARRSLVVSAFVAFFSVGCAQQPPPSPPSSAAAPSSATAATTSRGVLQIEDGFVDANGVLIYYQSFGVGRPLLILHGGPGASHDYFLPYLVPLARTNRLVFIDERGSGRSQKLEDAKGYTVENMVEDVES